MASLLALPQPSFGHLRAYAVSTEIENISKRLLTLYPTPLLVAILVFLPFYIAYFSVSHKPHLPLKSGKRSKPKRGLEEKTRLGDKLPTGPPTQDTESTEIRVSKESVFPANWWSSDELFQLEKRAIFSKVLSRTLSLPPLIILKSDLLKSPGSTSHIFRGSKNPETIYPSRSPICRSSSSLGKTTRYVRSTTYADIEHTL